LLLGGDFFVDAEVLLDRAMRSNAWSISLRKLVMLLTLSVRRSRSRRIEESSLWMSSASSAKILQGVNGTEWLC
jgi:hypothetical protein